MTLLGENNVDFPGMRTILHFIFWAAAAIALFIAWRSFEEKPRKEGLQEKATRERSKRSTPWASKTVADSLEVRDEANERPGAERRPKSNAQEVTRPEMSPELQARRDQVELELEQLLARIEDLDAQEAVRRLQLKREAEAMIRSLREGLDPDDPMLFRLNLDAQSLQMRLNQVMAESE